MTRCAGRLLAAACFSLLIGCAGPVGEPNQQDLKEGNGLRSRTSTVATELRFVNRSGQTVHVYWLDYEGQRRFYQALRDGESYDQPTFLTHPWLVTDERGAAWKVYLPTERPQTIDISAPETR